MSGRFPRNGSGQALKTCATPLGELAQTLQTTVIGNAVFVAGFNFFGIERKLRSDINALIESFVVEGVLTNGAYISVWFFLLHVLFTVLFFFFTEEAIAQGRGFNHIESCVSRSKKQEKRQ